MPLRSLSLLLVLGLSTLAAAAGAQVLPAETTDKILAVATAAAEERCKAIASFDAAALDREEVLANSDYRRALGKEVLSRFVRYRARYDHAEAVLDALRSVYLERKDWDNIAELEAILVSVVAGSDRLVALEAQQGAVEAALGGTLVTSAQEDVIRTFSAAADEAAAYLAFLKDQDRDPQLDELLMGLGTVTVVQAVDLGLSGDVLDAARERHEQTMADQIFAFGYLFELQDCIERRRDALGSAGHTVEVPGSLQNPLDQVYGSWGRAVGSFRLDFAGPGDAGNYWDGAIDLRVSDAGEVKGLLSVQVPGSAGFTQAIEGRVNQGQFVGSVALFEWLEVKARIWGTLREDSGKPGTWHGEGGILVEDADIEDSLDPKEVRAIVTGARGSWKAD